jgi:hypothetical protein
MLSCHPQALPSHIDLADSVLQINDEVAFAREGGFTILSSTSFGLDQYGPSGGRQVTEQWGADATTDPQRLTELRDLYSVALGLPPLPPLGAIESAGRAREAREGRLGNWLRTPFGE